VPVFSVVPVFSLPLLSPVFSVGLDLSPLDLSVPVFVVPDFVVVVPVLVVAVPVFAEPGESPVSTPELYKEYPVIMSSGYRQPFYFLGQYRNIPWLRSFMEFPTCQLHPETAKIYGVEDGDIIWIESPRGRIRQKLRTFPGIKKGVLMATANCFYPEEPAKGYHGVFISNPNVLTSNDHLDPMYGSPDLTCLLCKVYKAKEGARKRSSSEMIASPA
jgi:anaerobic selenocysteine-containing dehydrogenase